MKTSDLPGHLFSPSVASCTRREADSAMKISFVGHASILLTCGIAAATSIRSTSSV